jgi:hypothetical protein
MKGFSSNFSGLALAGVLLLTSALTGQVFQGMAAPHMMGNGGQPAYLPRQDMPSRDMDGKGNQGAMFRLWKLTEYLDLTEEQGAKFFPRINEHRDRVKQLRKEQEKLSTEFMEQVEAGKVRKKDTEAYLDQKSKLQRAYMDEHYKQIRGSSDLLSDEQYARYAAFEDHFRKQIKERMGSRNMRRDKTPGGDWRKKSR